jgi:glucosamine-6-phosphate deaminase
LVTNPVANVFSATQPSAIASSLPLSQKSYREQALVGYLLAGTRNRITERIQSYWGFLKTSRWAEAIGTVGDVAWARRLAAGIRMPRLKIFEDREALSHQALEEIIAQLQHKPNSTFLLPTGTTPERMYELIVEAVLEGDVDFSQATIFMLDEYVGGKDYFKYIHRHLIDKLADKLPGDKLPKIHVLNGLTDNVVVETQNYERMIKEAGGIDLAVLGVGEEGHIGFNERGALFHLLSHMEKLSPSTLKANKHLMEGDYTHALTVGIRTILESKKILLLANGPKKALPIGKLFEGKTTTDVPVTALLLHDDVTVLVDEAAAPLLDPHVHLVDELAPLRAELGSVLKSAKVADTYDLRVGKETYATWGPGFVLHIQLSEEAVRKALRGKSRRENNIRVVKDELRKTLRHLKDIPRSPDRTPRYSEEITTSLKSALSGLRLALTRPATRNNGQEIHEAFRQLYHSISLDFDELFDASTFKVPAEAWLRLTPVFLEALNAFALIPLGWMLDVRDETHLLLRKVFKYSWFSFHQRSVLLIDVAGEGMPQDIDDDVMSDPDGVDFVEIPHADAEAFVREQRHFFKLVLKNTGSDPLFIRIAERLNRLSESDRTDLFKRYFLKNTWLAYQHQSALWPQRKGGFVQGSDILQATLNPHYAAHPLLQFLAYILLLEYLHEGSSDEELWDLAIQARVLADLVITASSPLDQQFAILALLQNVAFENSNSVHYQASHSVLRSLASFLGRAMSGQTPDELQEGAERFISIEPQTLWTKLDTYRQRNLLQAA